MNTNEYEIAISKFDKYPQELKPICYVLGLAGESGEVCEKVKKIIRDKGGKFEVRDKEIAKELGDVIWYVSRIASYYGFSLEEIIGMNYEKLKSRWERDVLGGDGDNR